MDCSKTSRLALMALWISLAGLPALARAQVGDTPSTGDLTSPDAEQRRREMAERLEQMKGQFAQRRGELEKRRLEMLSRINRPPQPSNVITRLSLQNATTNTLWVALYYLPYAAPGGTPGNQAQTSTTPWRLESWVVLNPGEVRYIGDTNNLTYYTYAIDSAGHTWGGDDYHRTLYFNSPPGYRDVGFKKHMIDSHPNTHTQGFRLRTDTPGS